MGYALLGEYDSRYKAHLAKIKEIAKGVKMDRLHVFREGDKWTLNYD